MLVHVYQRAGKGFVSPLNTHYQHTCIHTKRKDRFLKEQRNSVCSLNYALIKVGPHTNWIATHTTGN